ncbi:IclR family transcriptional regulator [soil metagenome]
MSRSRKNPNAPKVNSLSAGIRILQAMVDSPRNLGVTEVAAKVELPKSSVHRLLQTLIEAGFVTQLPASKRYALSPDIFRFVNSLSSRFGPTPRAYDVIKRESAHRGHSIFLSVLGTDRAITVFAAGPDTDTNLLGSNLPVYISSPAKALIAQYPPEEWKRFAPTGTEPKLTPYTNTDPAKFLKEIAQVRRDKVAWNLRGSELDVYSVGAVVPMGRAISQLAVTFVFNHARWQEWDPAELAAGVREVANRVGKALKAG